jgi:hypothetical protein
VEGTSLAITGTADGKVIMWDVPYLGTHANQEVSASPWKSKVSTVVSPLVFAVHAGLPPAHLRQVHPAEPGGGQVRRPSTEGFGLLLG